MYIKPYKPATPLTDNSTLNSVDVTVRKNDGEVSGLDYCIYEENNTGDYVQNSGILGASSYWQTIAGWGAGGVITVTGLAMPIALYQFQTRSANLNDAGTVSDYSTAASAGEYWTQTTDTDFNTGTTSNTVVSGSGPDAEVVLEGLPPKTGLSGDGGGTWSYKRELTINSSGALSDYQVQVVLNSGNFDYNHTNTDGSDVRFTDSDGDTELDYWLEEWDTGGDSVFWVKVPSIISGYGNLYVYYGNSSASYTGDEKNMMVSGYAEDVDTSNTFFTLTDNAESTEQALSGTRSIKAPTAVFEDARYCGRANITVPTTPYIEELAVYLNGTQTDGDCLHLFTFRDSEDMGWVGSHVGIHSITGEMGQLKHFVTDWITTGYTVPTGQWVRFRIVMKSSSFDLYSNDGGGWVSRVTDGLFIDSMSQGNSVIVDISNYDSITASEMPATYFDNFFARKYTSSEPTVEVSTVEEGSGYNTAGTFTSEAYNHEEVVAWDYLMWTEELGTGTDIEIQLATNKDNLTWDYKGPDGGPLNYYTTPSSEAIWPGHGDDTYIKYRAYLSDDNGNETPKFKDITITLSTTMNTPPDAPIPASPANGSGTEDLRPTLTWNVPADLDGSDLDFKVEISTDYNFGVQIPGSPFDSRISTVGFSPVPPVTQGAGQCSYTLQADLQPRTHYWKVSAHNGTVYSEESSRWSIDIEAIPADPANAQLVDININSMRLTWTDNSDNETGFKIEKSTDGITYNQIGTPGADMQSYSGAGMFSLEMNRQYWYKVRAYNGLGDSGYTSPATKYTLCNLPDSPGVNVDYDTTDGYHSDITVNTGSNPTGTEYAVSSDFGWLQGGWNRGKQ